MKKATLTTSIACLIASSGLIASPLEAEADPVHQITPIVTDIVDFATTSTPQWKTFFYFELDDARPDPKVTLDIRGQFPGTKRLIFYSGPRWKEFAEGLAQEAQASGPKGWRKIEFIVQNGAATVERGPGPVPFETREPRVRAEIDQVFPGHDPI